MQRKIRQLPEIKLIGIKVRTCRDDERIIENGKIQSCVMNYFHEQLFDKIPNRKKPGTTFCAYTEYETDCTGAYTYFIGEEVSSLENIPDGLEALTVPPQSYSTFTTEPGPMPHVVREAWEKIWQMTHSDLGGKRRYHTDFEIYDERSIDHQAVVLDINIGVES